MHVLYFYFLPLYCPDFLINPWQRGWGAFAVQSEILVQVLLKILTWWSMVRPFLRLKILLVYRISSCWCGSKRTGGSWTGSACVGDLSDFWKGGLLVREIETDHGYLLHRNVGSVCFHITGLLHNLGQTKSIKSWIKSHWPGSCCVKQ